MAANDTAALVVALSAQVSKFQKDMDQANQIANKSVKQIEDRFAAAGASIQKSLGNFAGNASSQLGLIGSVLDKLGPAGVGVAAIIGSAILAYRALSAEVEGYIEKLKRLKEVSDATQLTILTLQAIGKAGKNAGLDFDQVVATIEKLENKLEQFKSTGGGEFGDALLRIGRAFRQDIAGSQDFGTAIDKLAVKFGELTRQQQVLLARSIGGRNFADVIRLFNEIGAAGGLGNLEAQITAAGKAIDENFLREVARSKLELQDLGKATEAVWGKAFARDIQAAQTYLARWSNGVANAAAAIRGLFPAGALGIGTTPPSAPTKTTVNKGIPFDALAAKRAAEEEERLTAAAEQLDVERKRVAALGDAATAADHLKIKTLELTLAGGRHEVTTREQTRALSAFTLAQQAALLATRESLGIANEEEIVKQKLAELDKKAAEGAVKNAAERATAETIIRRQAKETAEGIAVRQSATPQLTKNIQDANNLMKQFDAISVSAMNSAADAFADVITGSKKVSDAIRDMVNSLVRDFSRAAFRSIFASIFGGPLQTAGSLLGPPARALGGPVMAGGTYAVGEHGPELFVPQQAGMIVPNEALRRGNGSGPPVINIMNNVDATGADAAAVSRLTAGLVALNASIETRVVSGLARHRALVG